MKLPLALRSSVRAPLLALLSLTPVACGPSTVDAGDGGGQPASTAHTAEDRTTTEHLLERSTERTELTCSGEWIDVYDFVHPDIKKWMTIGQFLQGKDRHTYSEPTEPVLLAREDGRAWLTATALWTPHLDVRPDNVPDNWDPTERIEWVETWELADGEWHMLWPPQEPSEFFADHPDLLRGEEGR